jgi:hypothetical protein
MRARDAAGEGGSGAGAWAVDWWKDVVGVDLDQALDVSLYRVLEWGGMEVLRPGRNQEDEFEEPDIYH